MHAAVPIGANARALPFRRRPDLHEVEQRFAKQKCYCLKDPVTLRYWQLREEEHFVLSLLDGRTSIEQIQRRFSAQFAPRILESHQVRAFLGLLHDQGLITSAASGQGEQLVERKRRLRWDRWKQRLANPLAIRFGGFRPQPLLEHLYPACRWMFGRWFLALATCLVASALTLIVIQWDSFQRELPQFEELFRSRNLLWLGACLVVAKVLHEFGHALTCRHQGAECTEMGLMLLVFLPCLYCNVSDSWMLPSKWRRMAVSGAGILVECVLAAICAWIWWLSGPGMIHWLCLHMMLVCSVGSLLFNGNPLLRYDGYFVLSDACEVPNLHERASAAVRAVLRRVGLWTDVEPRLPDSASHAWLALYGLASWAYRLFLVASVIWFLTQALKPHQLEKIGQLFALVVVLGILASPVPSAIAHFRRPSGTRAAKPGQIAGRWILLGLVLALLALIPLPARVTAEAMLEPEGARRIYVSASGTLKSSVRVGATVRAGEPLAQLEDLDLELEVTRLQGQVARQALRLRNLSARRNADPTANAQLPAAREMLANLQAQWRHRRRERARLTVTSPIAGSVLNPWPREHPAASRELHSWEGHPLDEQNQGCYLRTGDLLCTIGHPNRLEALLLVDERAVEYVHAGQRVKLLLDQHSGQAIWGTLTEISRRDANQVPPELVAAGRLPARNEERRGAPLQDTLYQVRVELDFQIPRCMPGAVGTASIVVAPRSLARRVFQYLNHTFRLEL